MIERLSQCEMLLCGSINVILEYLAMKKPRNSCEMAEKKKGFWVFTAFSQQNRL